MDFTITELTCYTYTEPDIGTEDEVNIRTQLFRTQVAIAHCHAAYNPELGYGNDVFSDKDKTSAQIRGVPNYVATPSGTLRIYEPDTEGDIIIYDNIPFDPNDSNHY